jgi:predicted nucleotidyltransferase
VGNTRLVSANQDSSLYAPLAELVLKTFGPVEAIGQHLAKVSRILKAYIFGSWAARYLGEPGGPPKDIDVLVIGNPDRDALFDAVLRAERQLGMPVNATVRSAYQWNDSPDGFIKQVRSSALVPLPINPGEKE